MARRFPLYSNYTDTGWRVVKKIAHDLAEAMFVIGALRKVLDQFGNHHGYQLIDDQTYESDLPSRHSSAALTARETEANAGLCGRSRTKHLEEHERIVRIKNGLPAEDFVELAQEKVRLWSSR